jgi:hypothetical protein
VTIKRNFEKDHSLKAMSERDPVGLLRVLLKLPWSEPVRVNPERREVSLRYAVDELLRATIKGYRALYLLEGESNFATVAADRAMRRTAAVGLRHFMDVIPILVLYNPNRPADRFRPRRKIKFGLLDLSARFVVVRLWKLDPSDILKHRRIHLMPMVAAMKSTPAQIHEAAMRIEQLKNPDERKRLRQEMATFAAVRYNEDEANELIGGQLNMMPPLEVVPDSDIGRKIERIGRFEGLERGRREGERKGLVEGEAKGRAEGEAKGRAEGEAEGMRKGMRAFLFETLSQKFPSLKVSESNLPWDDETLKRLMHEVLRTSDAAKVRRLIAESKN